MKNKITLVVLALLCTFTAFAGGQKRKVLIIGIDGTRSDALLQANTPNIDSLVAHGFYTFDSWHVDITVSGPSWSSIMTGTYHNKHGVTNNDYSGSNYWDYPYFPTRAKEVKPSLVCYQYTEWAPMSDNVYNDGWDLKQKGPDTETQTTGDAAVVLMADTNADCIFIYFDKVDVTGHSSGFTPTNPAYISAIEGIDAQIGRILNAMRSRPDYANEDWLVLMTTDHGGIGTGHGGNSIFERSIWWIGYSDRGVHLDQSTSAPQCDTSLTAGSTVEWLASFNPTCDPGTYNPIITAPNIPTPPNTVQRKMAPVQADLPVTALHHLIYEAGVLPDTVSCWNLDGRSWLCEIGLCDSLNLDSLNSFDCNNPSSGIKEVKQAEFSLHAAYYANNVTLWIPTASNENIVRIYSLQGQLVFQEKFASAGIKHNITLNNLPHGNYVLELQQNGKSGAKLFNW